MITTFSKSHLSSNELCFHWSINVYYLLKKIKIKTCPLRGKEAQQLTWVRQRYFLRFSVFRSFPLHSPKKYDFKTKYIESKRNREKLSKL